MPLSNSPEPSFDAVVIGAGALGLFAAAELRRRGRRTAVVDPGGVNASAVAAGMIAPAMESAVDDLPPATAEVLRRARDLWPGFAEATGVRLYGDLAEWRGGNVAELVARMLARGFQHDYDAAAARLTTREDAKVDPPQALAVLARGLALIAGRARGVARDGEGWRVETTAGVVRADHLVLATGAEAVVAGLPPEAQALMALVTPVRGQIGLVSEALVDHVVRGPGAYVAPMGEGCVIGATMEPGERSLVPDAARCEAMLAAAWAVLGQAPRPLTIDWRAGVRGTTPDGLPMAGKVAPGMYFALAPRRNGWLLGPLVGAVVADAIEGRPVAEPTLSPARFR
ncbi:FAD-dependent oxidoreductase [Brevundimonas naejangsanensis]|uniref:FAD-dependent oxidoreductase n=1 Tax=Brevundimonas naejangsanensis TaxID=588932 RepID=A0A494RGI3_9CAUL|nr:FAD-binding oxidoreductase [Brevundimonas naejangsanensis]AYG95525.1 FAD-dependent oxidoreductase [Brevundimonas naejangsanensis]